MSATKRRLVANDGCGGNSDNVAMLELLGDCVADATPIFSPSQHRPSRSRRRGCCDLENPQGTDAE